MNKIDRFVDKYRFLSNFYHFPFIYDDELWETVEHAFQAHKSLDEDIREEIRNCDTPTQAKYLGKNVELRSDWNRVKDGLMYDLLKAKFSYIYMKEKLLETGDSMLVEGNNWHDNYWGNCFCKKCFRVEGKNMLGRLLMKVRSELKMEKENNYE